MTETPVVPDPSQNGHQTGATDDVSNRTSHRWLLTRLVHTAAHELERLLPRADLDERDPDFVRERLPLLWLLAGIWYRAEVRGLGNIPDTGPVLLVGNHSGGSATPDTLVFTLAFSTYFGVERPFHQLVRGDARPMPTLARSSKFGAVAASPANARNALARDAALLVYPGGDRELHRPTSQRNRIDLGRRTGFLRLAFDQGVPIVPVVSIGGHETALFLTRGERLARWLALDRLCRMNMLPISLALPWGLNVGDVLGHIPVPAKITIETLPAIDLRVEFGPDPDLDYVREQLVGLMQDTLDALAAERRLPVIG